jgi:hypothetical protein
LFLAVPKVLAQCISALEISAGIPRPLPLCPYPKHAQYKGQGNTDDESNFERP